MPMDLSAVCMLVSAVASVIGSIVFSIVYCRHRAKAKNVRIVLRRIGRK
jgi:hypothetical protein